MSTTGKKEKLVKLPDVKPPQDIRENTKARRAWLATELAAIQAQPNRRARIVDTGSYQRISVWDVAFVEGRLRHRGVCQVCGASQVAESGTFCTTQKGMDDKLLIVGAYDRAMVLHGYKRPGDGSTYGRCPGVGHAPLNLEKRITEFYSTNADRAHQDAVERVARAKAAEESAMKARYHGEGPAREQAAYTMRPQPPRIRTRNPEHYTDAERQRVEMYRAAVKNWRQNFPLSAELEDAKEERVRADTHEWQMGQEAEHFRRLLTSGVHGSALEEEVVA